MSRSRGRSILCIRVGPRGRVICLEPHPQVFESLRENVEIWRKDHRCGSFVLHQAALGIENGDALLCTNDWFRTNHGTAWISNKAESTRNLGVIKVPIRNLDSLLDEVETIGVMEIDVQGSELGVLQGMTRLLERRAIRDIIFEEEAAFPDPTHNYLKSKGYSIFGLRSYLLKCVACLTPNLVSIQFSDQYPITLRREIQTAPRLGSVL
jgi:FkbM family methyltransferase